MKSKKRKLLFSVTRKDLVIDFFSGTGAGGQHRNKHQNCVRISHPASGALSTGQASRSRQSNIRHALNSLIKHPKFKVWHSGQLMGISGGPTIDQVVDMQMTAKNLLIEKKEAGKWVQA